MKLLGIIGGIAPESTIEYYRLIIAAWRRRRPGEGYPALLINSIDVERLLALTGAGELAALTAWLAEELARLERAGARLALLAANTPHIVFDELQSRSPMRLISIVEAAADYAAAQGMRKVGLFGTRFTMRGGFYEPAFARAGIEIVVPREEDADFIHAKYVGELIHGVFRAETREALLAIIERMRTGSAIDGVVLGGTELPLVLRGAESPVPLLDTARIHAERAVDEMLGDDPEDAGS
ncbi:MAG TPA: amino acid racemase [Thermoanaerobaculia bacterium]|nr:amino acid racemase [Thermoanaerobaculia bacterium]